MSCKMADRSVVVNKSEPMKAGNSLEDKTWMSIRERKKTTTDSINIQLLRNEMGAKSTSESSFRLKDWSDVNPRKRVNLKI
ncbi:hypothetical protein [Paenibacillus sp. Soil787]|uniref:hypothetical protein n=1 Tax=Paenibacillus sp. Soil787 TaxID=1736411 RepID=UPI0006FF30A7|nr:hypothetical protein [Paenibacillus sp. Soil787]KRF31810.1 hypothetical protein ASG93_05645 [Paenibacillus sp. Soil787]